MALEVEPDVALRGAGEESEARVRLVGEVLDAVLARAAVVQLERRLVAEPLERLRADPVDSDAGGRVPERLERGDPRGQERLGVATAEAGDEDGVVVRSQPLAAEASQVADPAVLARPRVGRWRCLGRPEEPLPRTAVEGDVVRGAEGLPLSRGELDVHLLGQAALDPLELLCVEAEL